MMNGMFRTYLSGTPLGGTQLGSRMLSAEPKKRDGKSLPSLFSLPVTLIAPGAVFAELTL
jgi:hypothetical protein